MDRTKQSGFTLIEMSIVVLILGLITGAFFTFLKQKREQDAYKITVERQQKIATALSEYAQLRYRLPCPGRPNPPGGSEVLGDPRPPANSCTGISSRMGIVPFRALGLSIDDALDGYGNPFTYVVDAKATVPEFPLASSTTHATCLKSGVWMDGTVNRNPYKAMFCCQQVTSNLNIEFEDSDGNKTSVITPQGTGGFTSAFLDSPQPSPPTDQNVAYIAYALISHGANGEEAYIFGKSNRRDEINASDDERENADLNNNILIKAKSTASGNDYFDDIILWRTQQRMMTELNSNTCAVP